MNAEYLSFFDDDQKTPFEFVKVQPSHHKALTKPPLITANLYIKSLGSHTSLQGTFALHDNLITFYQKGYPGTPELVLDIDYAKLKCNSNLSEANVYTKISVSIKKNGKGFEVQFPEKMSFENWMKFLKGRCILMNFHEEYKANKMIGKGGFARVYLVEGKSTGKLFAVKAFSKEAIAVSHKANPKQMMLNEINLMRTLDHETLIKLYEVFETEKSIYLVMELIEGKPLQEPLAKGTFKKNYSEKKVMEMIFSILDALVFLSSKGIMHRDMKPDNILIDKTGRLKIIDFGLATYVNESEYIFKKCGTPGYIAPEVFKYDMNKPATFYNEQCDIFSVGCMMFYMIFGFPFFDGSGPSEILQLNREFNELDRFVVIRKELANPKSSVSRDALNLLQLMLDHDPKKRIKAIEALYHPYMGQLANSSLLKVNNPEQNFGSQGSLITINQVESTGSIKGIEIPSFKIDAMDKSSPLLPPKNNNRFTEKDSFLLDVGRPEMNGRLDSLSTGSATGSLFLKGNSNTDSVNSTSSFANKGTLTTDPGKKVTPRPSKTPHHTGANNQSFLKAAIFNRIKNTEGSKSDLSSTQLNGHQRHNSDFIMRGKDSEDSSSGELDDVGEEDCHLERDFQRLKSHSAKMHPNRTFFIQPRQSTMPPKTMPKNMKT